MLGYGVQRTSKQTTTRKYIFFPQQFLQSKKVSRKKTEIKSKMSDHKPNGPYTYPWLHRQRQPISPPAPARESLPASPPRPTHAKRAEQLMSLEESAPASTNTDGLKAVKEHYKNHRRAVPDKPAVTSVPEVWEALGKWATTDVLNVIAKVKGLTSTPPLPNTDGQAAGQDHASSNDH